ncbi:uncharacterized protein LOC119100648 [Pollicipes pollicipes]|uniref:uncharacterized protein LOC119100648 n=1 Tax=Pollicipes pollicipes TaxID=41117 RepID=UPI001884C69A|nr:uncharacterized protein LOC119100648 [Pollicipes pollicipes]
MRRLGLLAMTSDRPVGLPALLSLLPVLALLAVTPAAASPTTPRAMLVASAELANTTTTVAPVTPQSTEAPVGGYVRTRDGRRVAAVRRSDLLRFRRLLQVQLTLEPAVE